MPIANNDSSSASMPSVANPLPRHDRVGSPRDAGLWAAAAMFPVCGRGILLELMASPAWRRALLQTCRADRTFDQPLDAQFEGIVGVGDLLPGREHLVAFVVLQRALIEFQGVVRESLPRLEHRVLHLFRHLLAERADGDHVLPKAPAKEIGIAAAGLPGLHEIAGLGPIPLSPRQEAV